MKTFTKKANPNRSKVQKFQTPTKMEEGSDDTDFDDEDSDADIALSDEEGSDEDASQVVNSKKTSKGKQNVSVKGQALLNKMVQGSAAKKGQDQVLTPKQQKGLATSKAQLIPGSQKKGANNTKQSPAKKMKMEIEKDDEDDDDDDDDFDEEEDDDFATDDDEDDDDDDDDNDEEDDDDDEEEDDEAKLKNAKAQLAAAKNKKQNATATKKQAPQKQKQNEKNKSPSKNQKQESKNIQRFEVSDELYKISLERQARCDSKILFIKNFDPEMTEKQLIKLSPDIVSAHIVKKKNFFKDNQSKDSVYGFLQFNSESAAVATKEKLDNKKVGSFQLKVNFAGCKRPDYKAPQKAVFNAKKIVLEELPLEATIEDIAKTYPNAFEICFPRFPKPATGYRVAYVMFHTHEDAEKAFREGENLKIHGKNALVVYASGYNRPNKSRGKKRKHH